MTDSGSDVECAQSAWDELEKHVFSSTDREVGGILVGRIADGKAIVTTALPALAATSGSANVTFTHEVWEQVHEQLDRDHPDERIVGWYHSHPGFGVFLSEYDRFAHRSFFEDPALLALVVDPLSGEAGWFAMRDGEPTAIASRLTDRDPLRPASDGTSTAASPAARRGAGTVVGIALAAAVIGFFAGSASSTRTVVKQVAATSRPSNPVAPVPTPAVLPSVRLPVTPTPASLDYRVRAGDSLWDLAASFYGDPNLWPRLKAANPEHPSNLLDVGEHLRVPVSLKAVP